MLKPRPLRADAERNRRQILEVAETVFAAEGLAVPIDEIARRAGLGVGTLYRHFATKEELFSAILVTRMEVATEHARTALAEGAPGEAFFGFATEVVTVGCGTVAFRVEAQPAAGAIRPEAASREASREASRARRVGRIFILPLLGFPG